MYSNIKDVKSLPITKNFEFINLETRTIFEISPKDNMFQVVRIPIEGIKSLSKFSEFGEVIRMIQSG